MKYNLLNLLGKVTMSIQGKMSGAAADHAAMVLVWAAVLSMVVLAVTFGVALLLWVLN
ncbi:hypothetical protein [Neisseria animalis]|uniref:hypothetical protein n=1 Tax=Neisseria animalis TaxID=492 RepID=UPI000F71F24A|nr:hypothetical protein [Neisseria animalis]VEE07707.1 Uncharacterised protein [Neisseria animalis]